MDVLQVRAIIHSVLVELAAIEGFELRPCGSLSSNCGGP